MWSLGEYFVVQTGQLIQCAASMSLPRMSERLDKGGVSGAFSWIEGCECN